MHIGKTLLGILVLILLSIAYGSLYTVNEGQQALLTRLGEIINDPDTGKPYVIGPGLHFKMPFINQVQKFDTRLQTFTVQSSRILTQEQKYVLVDYYVKWRIHDLPIYYQRTGGQAFEAENLLQQRINDALRAAFGRRTITEVVSGERENIMENITRQANQGAQNLGVMVVDVRIKSIDLPKEVSDSVFSRMRAEREQVATKHRADGKAQAEAIRAMADAKAAVVVAQSNADAAKIRAEGTREAAEIYTAAYSRDPNFYAFYRSIQAYQNSFNQKRDILLLSPDSEFFKYFKDPDLSAK